MAYPFILATIALVLNQPVDSKETVAAHPLQALIDDASKLSGLYASSNAGAMLDEVANLPVCEPSPIYAAWRPNRGYTLDQYESLDESSREGLRQLPIESVDYYSTFYGSPLVYARILDIVDQHAPSFEVRGARIMDLGYGQLGQLRLWAQMGADVVGVEIDPILTALYDECEALGDVDGNQKTAGSVTLVQGAWPNDESCRDEVGEGFDLFVSRNLLKRGYVKPAALNPAFPVPVGWDMSDTEVVGYFYDLMNDGGIVVIESLGPKPDPAKPWSDIANPWAQSVWEQAGFEVLAHNADESEYARTMGRALGWDSNMDLDNDLYGLYSVYRKPVAE